MNPNLKTQFHTIENYWTAPDWLKNRMLFLSGPRQVGKTTLIRSTLCPAKEAYFNWDHRGVRNAFKKDPDFFSALAHIWLCFDEIHKRPGWKDILKGIYDTYQDRYRFAVIGSARLDTFKKSGDSLVGRYFHTHLFPLNLPDFSKNDFILPPHPEELIRMATDGKETGDLEALLVCGGFPEPFFSGSEGFWKRWSANHRDLIIREDLRDLTRVIEIDKIDALLGLLNPSIGHTLSLRNLASDLETTHGSVKRWLDILNKVELIFPVPPYSKKIRRAYKQEKKWYYTDWRAALENGFENYVAASLNRAVTLWKDRFGEPMSLHFLRTHDGTEVDFLINRNEKPWLLIEAKKGQGEITRGVHRFTQELGVPCLVVTAKKNIFRQDRHNRKIYVISWEKLGQVLP